MHLISPPSFSHFDFRSLDEYIQQLRQTCTDAEHKIYSSTDFRAQAKILTCDGVIYFHRFFNFTTNLEAHLDKDSFVLDLPIDKHEIIVNGSKYGPNRQFFVEQGFDSQFIYPPGEKITLIIAKATLNKYLSDEEITLFHDAVNWFQKYEVWTEYKIHLIRLIQEKVSILENLIKLQYTQPLLFEELTESVIHALLAYIDYHRNHNLKPIKVKNSERVMKRVIDCISNSDVNQLTVSELSKNTYISIRALQYIFKKEMGMAPKQFLTIEKLNLIRNNLKNSNPNKFSEAQILNKYGVTNLSRFRRDYHRFFNEYPKDTLPKR